MPVLHARHFPLSCSVLFSQTVWAFEGWPSIHISIAITLCYYLSGTSVEKITFLFMFRSESSHFMPTFLWLFKQNENVSIQVQSFPLFCILVEFGCQPENISEVTNTLNVALTWRHFTRGSKCDSNHFRHKKQQPLVLAFLSLFDTLMQYLHHLQLRIHRTAEQYSFWACCVNDSHVSHQVFKCFDSQQFVFFWLSLLTFLTCSHLF